MGGAQPEHLWTQSEMKLNELWERKRMLTTQTTHWLECSASTNSRSRAGQQYCTPSLSVCSSARKGMRLMCGRVAQFLSRKQHTLVIVVRGANVDRMWLHTRVVCIHASRKFSIYARRMNTRSPIIFNAGCPRIVVSLANCVPQELQTPSMTLGPLDRRMREIKHFTRDPVLLTH